MRHQDRAGLRDQHFAFGEARVAGFQLRPSRSRIVRSKSQRRRQLRGNGVSQFARMQRHALPAVLRRERSEDMHSPRPDFRTAGTPSSARRSPGKERDLLVDAFADRRAATRGRQPCCPSLPGGAIAAFACSRGAGTFSASRMRPSTCSREPSLIVHLPAGVRAIDPERCRRRLREVTRLRPGTPWDRSADPAREDEVSDRVAPGAGDR